MSVKTENPNTTLYHNAGIVLVISSLCKEYTLYCVTVTLFFPILIISGIALNILVCYVMVKSKRYTKSISCFLITHLAFIEVIYRLAVTAPMVVMSLPSRTTQDVLACKAVFFISTSCQAAIFGSLVAIAIDRHRNIVHPLASLTHSKKPIRVVLLVWFYAVTSSTMFLYTVEIVDLKGLPEGKLFDLKVGMTTCDIRPDYIGGISVTVAMVMTFLFPLVIIVIVYTAIFIALKRRCQNGLVHKAAAKSKSKAAKMLIIVVSGFVICWTPNTALVTIRQYRGLATSPSSVLTIASIVTKLLVLCSSLVNPVIYVMYSSGFKHDFIKICN